MLAPLADNNRGKRVSSYMNCFLRNVFRAHVRPLITTPLESIAGTGRWVLTKGNECLIRQNCCNSTATHLCIDVVQVLRELFLPASHKVTVSINDSVANDQLKARKVCG